MGTNKKEIEKLLFLWELVWELCTQDHALRRARKDLQCGLDFNRLVSNTFNNTFKLIGNEF